jgi:hypothetical protein
VKSSFLLRVVCLLALLVPFSASAALNDGLVLHYSFDAAPAGGIIQDLSALDNDGTVVGSPALVAGQIGGAWSFNGTSDYIWRLGNASLNVGTQFTASIWYKAASYNVQRPLMEWCLTSAGLWRDYGLHLWCNVHGGDWVGSGANLVTTWAGDSHIISVPDLSLNAWHHMVVTFSKATGDALLYMDGRLVSSQHFGAISPLTAADFYISRRPSVPTAYWHGLLDDARVYNRVLSAAEVTALYNYRPAGLDDGLVLYLPFDSDGGPTAPDESGLGNHARISGAVFSPDGRAGGAYYFDGVNDIMKIEKNPSLNVPDHFTLSVFMKPYSYANQRPILSWFSTNQAKAGVHMWTHVYGYQWQGRGTGAHLCGTDGVENNLNRVISVSDPTLNTWHHLVITYDRGTGTGQLYLDGSLLQTKSMGSYTPMMTNDVYVGGTVDGSGWPILSFHGLLDEVRVYGRVLSAADINALYQGWTSIDPPYITLIGFSNDEYGDQDVTEFYQDETLYVRVRDVDLEADDRADVRMMFQQARTGARTINLERQEDGAFTGSIPLRRFRPGSVRVFLQSNGRTRLMKDSALTILPE